MHDQTVPIRVPVSRGWGAVLGTALVLLAAGCSEDVDLPERQEPGTATAPTPAVEFTAEEQAAVDEALQVFDAYVATFAQLATEGVDITSLDHYEELGQYGEGDEGFSTIDLDNYSVLGQRGTGVIDWNLIEVTEVDLGADPPVISLRACLDRTGWTLVEADTGTEVVGPGSREPVLVTATFRASERSELRPEPAWRISGRSEEGQEC